MAPLHLSQGYFKHCSDPNDPCWHVETYNGMLATKKGQHLGDIHKLEAQSPPRLLNTGTGGRDIGVNCEGIHKGNM